MSTTTRQHVNHIRDANGQVRAVCEFCGEQSPPTTPDTSGEPDLWELPAGWGVAPYPADHVHRDGSVGSLFECPGCVEKLRAGQKLKIRNH